MSRTASIALVAGLAFASVGSAQTAGWRFQLSEGQTLEYRAEQTMAVTEIISGNKTETSQKLTLVKRWKVTGIDAKGIATVQQSLASLRIEQKTFAGEVLIFDSSNAEKSNPLMREQLAGYVGKVLAELRVDRQGRVVEVKQSKTGKPSEHEIQLPFTVLLPDAVPQPGQAWQRSFVVTLDPPHGTGEKFEASQEYTLKSLEGATATIGMTTAIKNMPKAVADQIPLLQFLPKGEIVFDTKSGQVRNITLDVMQELKDHHGIGSSYTFQWKCVEQLMD